MKLTKPGLYRLRLVSNDGAGNKTIKNLGTARVLAAGVIRGSGAKTIPAVLSVFERDNDTNGWVMWDAGAYGQQNPISTTTKGQYGLYLPAGTYYLRAQSNSYQPKISKSLPLTGLR